MRAQTYTDVHQPINHRRSDPINGVRPPAPDSPGGRAQLLRVHPVARGRDRDQLFGLLRRRPGSTRDTVRYPGYRTGQFIERDGYHWHALKGTSETPSPDLSSEQHTHTFNVDADVGGAGNTDPGTGTPFQARDGKPAYSYLSNVRVSVDSPIGMVDITDNILQSLGWSSLGDGTKTHALTDGTGPIDLIRLGAPYGVSFEPGPHIVTLSVPEGAGGKILYNLYVE